MNSLASHANHPVLLGAALLCAAAWTWVDATPARAIDAAGATPAAASIPIASDARLAGDGRQTRFILDLDKTIQFRAFALSDPYRVVVDTSQVSFHLPEGAGATGRGLVKAFRYGMVMPGGSRIVFDLAGPARIANSYVLDSANGQPPRLVLELEAVDSATFAQSLGTQTRSEPRPEPKPAPPTADAIPFISTPMMSTPGMSMPVVTTPVAVAPPVMSPPVASPPVISAPDTEPAAKPAAPDPRPVVVIDPGHGGVDNGTQSGGDIIEKDIVLSFAQALRDRLEKSGKYHVVMTRTDDTFIPLADRVKVAHGQGAALFVSIHADALPKGEGEAQGATIYTLSDKASDAEAERLADNENRADAIGGVNLTEAPVDVADILIDLAQRETRTFSNRFARLLMGEMKTTVRLHKRPLKSAGFRVLKAADVPSVLVELGYVSNKEDLDNMVSDAWRTRAVGSMARAVDTFLAKRVATTAQGN
jgi:N-acetylmuramoyl-L-alanine amidase